MQCHLRESRASFHRKRDVTTAEAAWRAARTQQLLAEGLERFEAMAKVREEAKAQPWTLLNK